MAVNKNRYACMIMHISSPPLIITRPAIEVIQTVNHLVNLTINRLVIWLTVAIPKFNELQLSLL